METSEIEVTGHLPNFDKYMNPIPIRIFLDSVVFEQLIILVSNKVCTRYVLRKDD